MQKEILCRTETDVDPNPPIPEVEWNKGLKHFTIDGKACSFEDAARLLWETTRPLQFLVKTNNRFFRWHGQIPDLTPFIPIEWNPKLNEFTVLGKPWSDEEVYEKLLKNEVFLSSCENFEEEVFVYD